jgi:hypothetical protein
METTAPEAFKAECCLLLLASLYASIVALGLTIFLLLADLRSGLSDAAFYEISLNLELLLRA